MVEQKIFHQKIKRGDEIAEFDLKEPLWIDDMAIQAQCTDQKGNLNHKDLWIKRLEAATGKSSSEIMKLELWKISALQVKWLALFDVNPATFLEDSTVEEKSTSANST